MMVNLLGRWRNDNKIRITERYSNLTKKMNEKIYEELLKYNIEVENTYIIERYTKLQLSPLKRLKFLFTGV